MRSHPAISVPSGLPSLHGGAPVRREFLAFANPLIGEEEITEVVDTLRSGWLGTGPKTRRFEEQFRKYARAKYALALNSCTAGLHLALEVLGVGPGDEVITTPMIFPGTVNAIIHTGAKPVFVDVERDTFNIDLNRIEQAITRRTKVILPVHMCGRPCEMDPIMGIARRHGIFVVEDAAHAAEAWYKRQKVGSIGDITAFSFYATRNIIAGEGGMVTTANEDWAAAMRIKSLHGIRRNRSNGGSADGFRPYETVLPGYKYSMMDLQAAIGIHQLARAEANLKIRERHWQAYNDGFALVPELITPGEQSGIRHARHLYTVLLRLERMRIDRMTFLQALKSENIGAGVHFTAVHLHKYHRATGGYRPWTYPNAEYVGERTISLPLSPKLTDQDIRDVIAAVRKLILFYRR